MRINVPIPTATMEAKIDVVDGYHDVPTADVADNAQMRDVIGNKADTLKTVVAATNSVMSYVKGAIYWMIVPTADSVGNSTTRDIVGNKSDAAQTTVATTRSTIAYVKGILNALAPHVTALGVVDGYHDVPTADTTDDAQIRDVVGRKTDTDNTTIGTTSSLMRYIKGILKWTHVPTVDITNNYSSADVVGNKSDAAQTTVGTTRSTIAYVKGLLNALATHVTALATHDTALGVVDGNVDNLEAERLQRVVARAVQATTASDTLADVVNISDKGVLTGISQMAVANDSMKLKVIIDGVTILDTFTFTKLASCPRSIAFNHRFDTSLQVQHSNTGNAEQVQTLVSYTTD